MSKHKIVIVKKGTKKAKQHSDDKNDKLQKIARDRYKELSDDEKYLKKRVRKKSIQKFV